VRKNYLVLFFLLVGVLSVAAARAQPQQLIQHLLKKE
jgi:hypothetical protein